MYICPFRCDNISTYFTCLTQVIVKLNECITVPIKSIDYMSNKPTTDMLIVNVNGNWYIFIEWYIPQRLFANRNL